MKKTETDKAYLNWIYRNIGMGSRRTFERLKSLADPEQLYRLALQGRLADGFDRKFPHKNAACREKLRHMEETARQSDVIGEYEQMLARGIRFAVLGEEEYPRKLAQTADAPGALYYAGRLPDPDKKTVAVIGSRSCTEYGKAMAREFAQALAQADMQVVSGMARGIDGLAQQAALEAHGYSMGVLGCGVDVCYPPENRSLYEALIASGGVCSEYPPGTGPRAVLFPPRNRIISGLCDSVLVIEAKERSGTLITVDMALEQGREVYVVPGRITDPLSRGCNELIRQGAVPALSPKELTGADVPGRRTAQAADDMRGRILGLLDYQPQTVEDIKQKYDAAYGTISVSGLYYELVQLCAEGTAVQTGGRYGKKG